MGVISTQAAFEAVGLDEIMQRKRDGWDLVWGTPTHRGRRKKSISWRRGGRTRLGGGKQSVWDGLEARGKASHEEKNGQHRLLRKC